MTHIQVDGPYRAKRNEEHWEVFEIINGIPHSLRPRKVYFKRESAYAQQVRMNRRWLKEKHMNEALQAILKEMQSWQGPGGEDIAHSEADELLCKLARTLAMTCKPDVQKNVEEIIQAWQKVEKWYA